VAVTGEGGALDLQETSSAPGDEVPKAEEAVGTTTSGTGDVAEGE